MNKTEELLKRKMQEGWNINIECKGLGRNYQLSYEATAYKVNTPIEERLRNFKHAVGDTIEELIKNLGI